MRITGGSARSRRFSAPRGLNTRPTSEKVREALFNILFSIHGAMAPGTRVLDLFAGAGTLGLEAMSRGAEHLVLVDSSRTAVKFIRENLDALGMTKASKIHCGDVPRTLARLDTSFHLVFLDPPYASDLVTTTMTTLGTGSLLAPDAIVIAEHDRRHPTSGAYGCLVKVDCRRYGDTELSFFRRDNQ